MTTKLTIKVVPCPDVTYVKAMHESDTYELIIGQTGPNAPMTWVMVVRPYVLGFIVPTKLEASQVPGVIKRIFENTDIEVESQHIARIVHFVYLHLTGDRSLEDAFLYAEDFL